VDPGSVGSEIFAGSKNRDVYIGKSFPLGVGYQSMSLGGGNMKREKRKKEN
jgi:hypothetical protein